MIFGLHDAMTGRTRLAGDTSAEPVPVFPSLSYPVAVSVARGFQPVCRASSEPSAQPPSGTFHLRQTAASAA